MDSVRVLGVDIGNVSQEEALAQIETWLGASTSDSAAKSIFIANAHTLNLSAQNPRFRATLNSASVVFGDGTGVRWAAKFRGTRMRDNLVGTDLMPALFRQTANKGYRYFLLGATPTSISKAASYCSNTFPGWEQAGFHQGYLSDEDAPGVIQKINDSNVDLLLVGMGNPIQEQWIEKYQPHLNVKICVGVGGLFNHWAGDLTRAPLWVRKLGCEWIQLLLQSPMKKARRYLIGNPLFLYRIARFRNADLNRRLTAS